MKKIFALILAVMMIATMSTTAFAAETATNEGGNTTINVEGTFVAAQDGAGTKISVDIAWSGMEFTYYGGVEDAWDPSIHDYKDTEGYWSTNKGTITVTNHSNTGVTATLSFTPAVVGVIGTFDESVLTLPTAVGTDVTAAPCADVEFGISGAAITETVDTLGTITVTIAKAD